MQKELISNLNLVIAKLELKQLEIVNKLSVKSSDDYLIRCIICPETSDFIAVNGDWGRVIGIEEYDCVGKSLFDFISVRDIKRARKQFNLLLDKNEFDSFVCDMIDINGNNITVDWKAKYSPKINGIISIGRVKNKI